MTLEDSYITALDPRAARIFGVQPLDESNRVESWRRLSTLFPESACIAIRERLRKALQDPTRGFVYVRHHLCMALGSGSKLVPCLLTISETVPAEPHHRFIRTFYYCLYIIPRSSSTVTLVAAQPDPDLSFILLQTRPGVSSPQIVASSGRIHQIAHQSNLQSDVRTAAELFGDFDTTWPLIVQYGYEYDIHLSIHPDLQPSDEGHDDVAARDASKLFTASAVPYGADDAGSSDSTQWLMRLTPVVPVTAEQTRGPVQGAGAEAGVPAETTFSSTRTSRAISKLRSSLREDLVRHDRRAMLTGWVLLIGMVVSLGLAMALTLPEMYQYERDLDFINVSGLRAQMVVAMHTLVAANWLLRSYVDTPPKIPPPLCPPSEPST